MKVIVTTKEIPAIKGYKIVSSIRNLDWQKVTCLIFNSTKDDDLTFLLELAKIRGIVNCIIYINSDIDPLYCSVFNGLGADIYNDEASLQDKDILDFMVNKFGKTGFTLASATQDFSHLNKCITDVLKANDIKADKLLKNELWLKTLNSALASLDTSIARSGQVDTDMVELLGKAQNLISELKANNEKVQQELENLATNVEVFSTGATGVPLIYGCYTVPSATKKILYIKFYGHCQYLTSFLMAYQHYLKQIKSYSSKFLAIYPKLPVYMTKYQEMPRLASDSISIISMDYTAYCTFEPKKSILEKFFNTDQDLYIVIDLMYGNDLLKGAHVKKMNAVSGLKDLDRFGLKAKDTFFSVCGDEAGFVIPYLQGYSKDTASDTARRAKYFEQCKILYERLDKILSL